MPTYKVKKGQTYASLAEELGTTPQQLLKMNQGMFSLSAGRVIKVPKFGQGGQGGQGTRPPVNTATRGAYPQPQNVQPVQGQLQPYPLNTLQTYPLNTLQQPNTLQPYPLQPQNVRGAYGRGAPQQQPATPQATAATADPFAQTSLPVYTGNPDDPNTALWKARWNAQARAGKQPSAPPPVMTRNQIWNMKAAQRRRRAAEAEYDAGGGSSGGGSPAAAEIIRGNAVNTGLNWRIG